MVIFSPNGILGNLFFEIFGFDIVFTWFAAALASALVSFPLMVRPMMLSFSNIDSNLIKSYVEIEKENTIMDLHNRIKSLDSEKNNEILVTIDANKFTEQDFQYIQQLSEILADSGEPGFHGELGNITVEIFENMNTFEKELI